MKIMKWHRIEPGKYTSDTGWEIERHEGYCGGKPTERWWNPYAPGEDRGFFVEESFRTLKEAKEYAEEQAAQSGVPYQVG